MHPTDPGYADALLLEASRSFDLDTSEGRKTATCVDPLLFAIIYLPDLISDDLGNISFSEAHIEWAEQAKTWLAPGKSRNAYIAPRGLGKSTWWFIILPMWAAAFGYVRYIAAFSNSSAQAWTFLSNFRTHLNTNELLQADFPDLCKPQMRPDGKPVANRENRYIAKSRFIFDCDGVDSSVLGKNVDGKRPDLIILDDIEPDEQNYSADLKDKQLKKVRDTIFYLNLAAKVVISGTVVMTGSIIHDLSRSLTETPEDWIVEEKIQVHHHQPILADEDGTERSIWPGNHDRFDLDEMQEIRNTTPFLKNYCNTPLAGDGAIWKPDFFVYGEPEGVGGLLLSIDPAVTTKRTSDFTALAVIGWSKTAKKLCVYDAWQLKRSSEELREFVVKVLDLYPIVKVLIEVNQGGHLWQSVFHDLPVPLDVIHQTDKKEFRFARAARLYEQGLVLHKKKLPTLEAQMLAVPKVAHDDLSDAVTSGVLYFANALKAKKIDQRFPRIRQGSYL